MLRLQQDAGLAKPSVVANVIEEIRSNSATKEEELAQESSAKSALASAYAGEVMSSFGCVDQVSL